MRLGAAFQATPPPLRLRPPAPDAEEAASSGVLVSAAGSIGPAGELVPIRTVPAAAGVSAAARGSAYCLDAGMPRAWCAAMTCLGVGCRVWAELGPRGGWAPSARCRRPLVYVRRRMAPHTSGR